MDIVLDSKADAQRLGEKDKTGRVIRWPELNAVGGAYKRPAYTTRQLNDTLFVVLPVGFKGTVALKEKSISGKQTSKDKDTTA